MPPAKEVSKFVTRNRYQDCEEVSSGEDNDTEFQQDFWNTVDASGDQIPGMSSVKTSYSASSYSLPAHISRLPFGGPHVHPVAAKWRHKIENCASAHRATARCSACRAQSPQSYVQPQMALTAISDAAKIALTPSASSSSHFIDSEEEACADSGATHVMLPN